MQSVKKQNSSLIITTHLFIRLLTLFLYIKKISVDQCANLVLIQIRYFWFFKSTRIIPFQQIQRIDYSCETRVNYQNDSRRRHRRRVENDVYTVSFVLNLDLEKIELARFQGLGNSRRDDDMSREFTDTLQALTGLPLTNLELDIPEDGGLFSLLDHDLQKILELCCMYLVSLDEEFTPIEQDWIDEKFGPGTSERFINEMQTINWETCFNEIHQRLRALPSKDQMYAKTQAKYLFQRLMEADKLKGPEQERLDHLMGFIREACYADEKPPG